MRHITLHTNLDSLEEAGLLSCGVQRNLSEEELASYAQAVPELEHVFDAIAGNHDEPPSSHLVGMSSIGSMGRGLW